MNMTPPGKVLFSQSAIKKVAVPIKAQPLFFIPYSQYTTYRILSLSQEKAPPDNQPVPYFRPW